jgi:hypothetical protein
MAKEYIPDKRRGNIGPPPLFRLKWVQMLFTGMKKKSPTKHSFPEKNFSK